MILAHLSSEYIIPDLCSLAVIECSTEETLEQKIEREAREVGVDPNLTLAIGVCESGLRNVKNPVSSAAGIFQLTRATADETGRRMGNGWGYKDVYDIEKNIKMALFLMSKGEYSRWECFTK